MDLENEFRKLVNGMYQSIQDKQAAGELSFAEAQQLRNMVHIRTMSTAQRQARAWNSSGCSMGTEDDWDGQTAPYGLNDEEEGWSSSSARC